MDLSSLILDKIRKNHRGKENAIRRGELLRFCRLFDPEITDREMRQIYSQLPVCTCEKGVFWPIRESEIDEYYSYLKKKALPLFQRWKRVAQVHRKLLSERHIEQLELF